MSVEEVLTTFLAVFIFAVIVVAANYADRQKNARMRQAVVLTLVLINGLIVLLFGLFPNSDEVELTDAEAVGGLVGSLILAGLATAVLFRPVRLLAAGLFPRFRGNMAQTAVAVEPVNPVESAALRPNPGGAPLFPQMLNYYTSEAGPTMRPVEIAAPAAVDTKIRGFNPDSTVHLVALVFALYLLGIQFVNFILSGGLSGVAESFEGGLSGWDLVINALPLLIIPLAGVGLGLRRSLPQTLQRLGLQMPSLEGIAIAFGITIGLLMFVGTVSLVWQQLVSEETFEEQTEASDALTESIDTVWLAFLLALTAAVSEEIAFRGALQPVFGFWPTALLFALTHAQYTLTPAALIILAVAVVFGWIRWRFSTTVAIFTHFFYNFIPLALSTMVSEEAVLWFYHLFF